MIFVEIKNDTRRGKTFHRFLFVGYELNKHIFMKETNRQPQQECIPLIGILLVIQYCQNYLDI
jgi:uncharacterized membrane protein